MDAGYLNFHKEEDFSSYFLESFNDDSQSFDGTNSHSYKWDCEEERELNGDVGLIPISSQTDDFCPLSSSPPTREDFKIMTDWNHLVNFEGHDDLIVDIDITASTTEDLLTPDDFDLTKYVTEPEDAQPRPAIGGKRIDMARRRYVVDENGKEEEDSSSSNSSDDDSSDSSDGESESEPEKKPVVVSTEVKIESEDDDEDCTVDVETVTESISHPVLQAGDLKSLLEQFEATESTNLELQGSQSIAQPAIIFDEPIMSSPKRMDTSTTSIDSETIEKVLLSPKVSKIISPIKSPIKRYQIPQKSKTVKELLPPPQPPQKETVPQTVKAVEEAPRKPKDQIKSKQILDSLPVELIDRIRQTSKRKPVPVIPPIVPAKKRVQAVQPVVVKEEKIEEKKIVQLDHDYCSNNSTPRKDSGFSSCEEDDRSILRSQPTVKNADGKLMVSLLKSNTIKKKLNLEEYKKRLQNRSQTNSGGSSPAAIPDVDENARRLKHQEKLMKMAEEIIQQKNGVQDTAEVVEVKHEVPSNMVMKTLVSVGTNTEESWGHLEQILQNTNLKISPNSLISSIVEHLPRVKPVIEKEVEHGEDKTIVYLDKEGSKPRMCSVHVQTIHSSTRRRRRRTSSESSRSSSSESSSSRGSSRSRTPSPVQRRNREQMKEVEERRVIYVGKIADNTTNEDLRKRFNRFGPITNISVHFRRKADNYGFVTFLHKEDAYEAVERGNEDPSEPEYVLSFGGRRLFCQTTYSDLDNVSDDAGYWSPISGNVLPNLNNSFDKLLKEAQAKLKQRQL